MGPVDSKLVIMGPSGESISSVDDWFAKAPPMRGEAHWKDDRSAKELARAWFRSGHPAVPAEIYAALAERFEGFEVTVAKPEHVTRFDAFPGGARNHDLLLLLRRGTEQVVVGVEGKAGEPLDATVIDKYERAMKDRDGGKLTNRPERILGLVEGLFGKRLGERVGLGDVRYQLLTASAGTLVEAKAHGASSAVVLVHEFGRPTRDSGISEAQVAIAGFISAFDVEAPGAAAADALYGPLPVRGTDRIPADMALYVGYVRAG
jgi:hypothetical protein